MINTTQTTTYNLSLTEDEFDVLYDTIQEEVYQIKESIGNLDLTLNDYEIYQIYKQMKTFREAN